MTEDSVTLYAAWQPGTLVVMCLSHHKTCLFLVPRLFLPWGGEAECGVLGVGAGAHELQLQQVPLALVTTAFLATKGSRMPVAAIATLAPTYHSLVAGTWSRLHPLLPHCYATGCESCNLYHRLSLSSLELLLTLLSSTCEVVVGVHNQIFHFDFAQGVLLWSSIPKMTFPIFAKSCFFALSFLIFQGWEILMVEFLLPSWVLHLKLDLPPAVPCLSAENSRFTLHWLAAYWSNCWHSVHREPYWQGKAGYICTTHFLLKTLDWLLISQASLLNSYIFRLKDSSLVLLSTANSYSPPPKKN